MEAIALRTQNANDRIALRGVRVRSRLAGMSQRTTVEQTFVNLEPRAIEAVYTFPLPESAAVCGFEVVTGDRVLTGVVEESERAIEKYEEAIGDGHAAYALEQVRPDVFTVRVGNIKPRQAATIRLTYVAALERVDKQIRVAFPTTVAPRYVTATGTDPLDAMVDGDALNPPHALHVPYGVTLEVEVGLGRDVRNVFSPSHSIGVERRGSSADGRREMGGLGGQEWPRSSARADKNVRPIGDTGEPRTLVTLAGGVSEMNRDIVISIELARETEPSVQLERGPNGESYLAVTFVPEFDVNELAAPQPSETFFVLDCSGSMQGDSIQQATAALELCLRSLSAGDTFNVCRFGSTFELMSSEPMVYSQQTLDRAIQYVRQPADLGGTELYAPLEAIFNVPPRTGKVRQVILLTDGQVSNEPACIQLARKHRGRNRLFTFGIGAASSAHLVKGLARATGGASEFIRAGERIDEKVLRTFGRLTSPQVADVSIDWDGCDVQTLAELPPVFDGDVLAVFGRAAGRTPQRVRLSCETPMGPHKWTVPVSANGSDHADRTIATMWARRMIQSLEDVNAIQRSHAPSKDESRERSLLINLSKEFGLLCSLTTFIAVEHRSLADRNEGRPALRRVPVQLAEGWGDVDLNHRGFVAACPAPAMGGGGGMLYLTREADETVFGAVLDEIAPVAAAAAPRQQPPKPARKRGMLGRLTAAMGGSKKTSELASAAPPAAPMMFDADRDVRLYAADGTPSTTSAQGSSPADELQLLLSRQQANGVFDWDGAVRAILVKAGAEKWDMVVGHELAKFSPKLLTRQISQTLAIVLLFRVRFPAERAVWQRAARKSVRDLAARVSGKSPAEIEQFLDHVLTIVTASA
jgi:Ca-activated chloride channel family protein